MRLALRGAARPARLGGVLSNNKKVTAGSLPRPASRRGSRRSAPRTIRTMTVVPFTVRAGARTPALVSALAIDSSRAVALEQ